MGQFAKLLSRRLRVLKGLVHECAGVLAVPFERATCQLERHDRVHEALLGPVVQVAHHPAALFVGGGDDPRSGSREV